MGGWKDLDFFILSKFTIAKYLRTFFIWFLPKDKILSLAIPFNGIMRSMEFVDNASRLRQGVGAGAKDKWVRNKC